MRKRFFPISSTYTTLRSTVRYVRALASAGALVVVVAACSSAPADSDIVVEFLQATPQNLTEVKSLDGETVTGTVSVHLRANDRITEARFYVDDEERVGIPAHIDADAPYTMELDTRDLADGEHHLTIATRVKKGSAPVTTLTFNADNVLEAPTQGEPVDAEESVEAGDGGSNDGETGGDTGGETDGDHGTVSDPTDPAGIGSALPAATLFVSPSGSDSNDGRSASSPLRSVQRAADLAGPGDVIYLRGGVYPINVRFTKSGTSSRPIVWASYPGEWAVFDGSDQTPISSAHKFRVSGASWNVFMNLEVRYGPQEGVYVENSHDNVFRGIVTHHHQYSGIGNIGSNRNVYERIVTHDNYDDHNPRGLYGDDADGIALSSGDSNIVRKVVTYGNSDDGIDAWRSTNTLIEGVVAYDNGRGTHGNGNGIKAGGNSEWNNTVVRNSIAFGNRANGFDDNSGQGITFDNNTAYGNGGYSFMGGSTTTRRNNIAVGGTVGMWGAKDSHNNWNLGIADPRFASTDQWSDAFLSLADGSPAIGAGVDLGFGRDLGAIAYRSTYAQLVGTASLVSTASLLGDGLAMRID